MTAHNSYPSSLNGLRALVVEDEVLIAEELRERLSKHGVTVVGVVDTGQTAIEFAEADRPELVLMDIRLKGSMDGIEAAQAIRARVQSPVVFLTAHSDQETLRRAKEVNADGYVLKPFSERDLFVTIEMSLHRHELERRLRESEKRYAATLASIGDGVIATDVEGAVTFINPVAEALTTFNSSEARGRPIEEVIPMTIEKSGELRENPCREAIRTRQTVTLSEPTLLVTRGSDQIPIDDTASPIMDRDDLLGAVMAFRDVRQRRLSEEALREAQAQLHSAQKMEAIGRLAGGLAHDFNNFLTMLNSSSELLLDGDMDSGSRKLLGDLKSAGDRAASLTRKLLALSRKQVMEPVALDLGELISEISNLLRRLLGESVTLTTRSEPGLWRVLLDPSQIEQVLLNLAANAADALPTGGRVKIETRNVEIDEASSGPMPDMQPGRYVGLIVSDTGTGMDATTLEHLFEPFYTTKSPESGTGLGLATTYGIVKQSGGFIDVKSEIGEGTTFSIWLPAVDAPRDNQARHDAPVVKAMGGDETILLVEDDDGLRPLVATVLRNFGYVVHEAENGEQAVDMFRSRHDRIHLVITDIVMPGINGLELTRRLRALDPDVPVLLMSGYASDAIGDSQVLEDDAPFLQKPFSPTALAEKVRRTIDS